MEPKFIKYKENQVNLAKLYRVSTGCMFDNTDIEEGTLVVGYYGDGKYLTMGYLCNMTRDTKTGEVIYEVTSAIEDDYTCVIQNPYRVNTDELPVFAATTPDSVAPVVGRVYRCNGQLAVMDTGFGKVTVNVNSILELTRYFKENK